MRPQFKVGTFRGVKRHFSDFLPQAGNWARNLTPKDHHFLKNGENGYFYHIKNIWVKKTSKIPQNFAQNLNIFYMIKYTFTPNLQKMETPGGKISGHFGVISFLG